MRQTRIPCTLLGGIKHWLEDEVFILLLLLDDPRQDEQVMVAWSELGIQGVYALESSSCRHPQKPPSRGPTGMLSFAELLGGGGHRCHTLLLATAATLQDVEQAAAAVERIVGPWSEKRAAALYALPVAASWGAGPDAPA